MIRVAIIGFFVLFFSTATMANPSKDETVAWLSAVIGSLNFRGHHAAGLHTDYNQDLSFTTSSISATRTFVSYATNSGKVLGDKTIHKVSANWGHFYVNVREVPLESGGTVLRGEKMDQPLSALELVCAKPRGCVDFRASFHTGSVVRMTIVVDRRLKDRAAKALSHIIQLNGGIHDPF